MTKTPLLPQPGAAALILAAVVFPATALAQPAPAPPPDLPAPAPAPVPPVAQPVPPGPPAAPVRGAGFPGTPIPGATPAPSGTPDWGAPPPAIEPPPPPEKAPATYPGVTAKGLPLAQRGGVVADVAGLLTSQSGGNSNGGNPIAAVDLSVHIPIAEHTFFDADLPLGFGALGNPMVGVHHVFRPLDRLWLTLGGAFGFPLINNSAFESFAAATAFWDAERFMAYKMPFAVRLGLEGHAGLFEFRLQGDPVWGISIASCPQPFGCNDARDVHFAAFQHAFEVQIGHEIGGGLRYQGVATGTHTPSIVGQDQTMFGGPGTTPYQGTLEPFFRLYHDPVFFRLGLLMPLSNPLGGPFDHTWGVRGTVGYSLD